LLIFQVCDITLNLNCRLQVVFFAIEEKFRHEVYLTDVFTPWLDQASRVIQTPLPDQVGERFD
jgi:hypothetical protein